MFVNHLNRITNVCINLNCFASWFNHFVRRFFLKHTFFLKSCDFYLLFLGKTFLLLFKRRAEALRERFVCVKHRNLEISRIIKVII